MSIIWKAKIKNINGIEQIHFSVKDSEKVNKISGTICLDEDEVVESDVVEYLKNKLGEQMVLEYENDAKNITDEVPVPLHLIENKEI